MKRGGWKKSQTIHLPMQFMTRDVFLNIWKRENIITLVCCCYGGHSSWDICSLEGHFEFVTIMRKYVISRVNLLIVCSTCMWSICESVILQFSSPTLSPRIRPSFKHSTDVNTSYGIEGMLSGRIGLLSLLFNANPVTLGPLPLTTSASLFKWWNISELNTKPDIRTLVLNSSMLLNKTVS